MRTEKPAGTSAGVQASGAEAGRAAMLDQRKNKAADQPNGSLPKPLFPASGGVIRGALDARAQGLAGRLAFLGKGLPTVGALDTDAGQFAGINLSPSSTTSSSNALATFLAGNPTSSGESITDLIRQCNGTAANPGNAATGGQARNAIPSFVPGLAAAQANMGQLRSALAAAGVSEHDLNQLFGNSATPSPTALSFNPHTTSEAEDIFNASLPTVLQSTPLSTNRPHGDPRTAADGDGDQSKQPANDSSSTAGSVLLSIACALLPSVAGELCSIATSVRDDQTAKDTANGLQGLQRQGQTGTTNKNEAQQLKELEQSTTKRPRDDDQGGVGAGAGSDGPNPTPQKVGPGGVVDPIENEKVEVDVQRLASGLAVAKQAKVNPNPEGNGAGGGNESGIGAIGPKTGPGVVDPPDFETGGHGGVKPAKPTIGPGGPIPRGGMTSAINYASPAATRHV